ncbi:hypothetical protein [Pedobacter punctiformis]|uniref:Uncharacterized protein n=1 Tax=Pedobacter punctiformis TaxID=3004097 RepID=A0ABT4LAX3_9SPHI|nr:hypothetical protein [Pedobacter sp. HCMS5-2]MCZ4245076.1 hypothetical protein [Pedobacter sp. HCMS5-2]
MKKLNALLKLRWIILLFSVFLGVQSCKKNEKIGIPDLTTEQLKSWFDKQSALNSVSKNVFTGYTPNWENIHTTLVDGYRVTEVNFTNPNKVVMLQGQTSDTEREKAQNNTTIKLLLFNQAGSSNITAAYMMLQGSLPQDGKEVHYKDFGSFTGTLSYYNITGKFENGYLLNSGKITRSLEKSVLSPIQILELREKQKTIGAKPGDKLSLYNVNDNCSVEVYDLYYESCTSIQGMPELGNVCSWVYVGSTTIINCIPGSGGGGGTSPDGGYPNIGGGGAQPTIPPVSVDTIMQSKFYKNPKAMCALNKLMQNNYYRAALNKFIGENKPIDLTFKLENIEQQPGFQTLGTTIPNPVTWNANNIDLTLAENLIDNLSSIEVALTLLHEGVHAEVFRKLITIHGPSQLNNANFPTLFNLYTQYRANAAYDHEYIARFYVETIASALKEYDNNKFGIDYYQALAWHGLKGTDAYQALTDIQKSEIETKKATLLSNRSKTNCNDQ